MQAGPQWRPRYRRAPGSCKLAAVGEVGRILAAPVGAGKQQTRTAQGITGDRCVWAAKKKGTGGLKGQPLQLEIVVESGATLVGDYNTAKSADPSKTDAVPGLGDDAFIKDLKLHVLVGARVLSTALHNYRYPKPLTQEQIQQKDRQARARPPGLTATGCSWRRLRGADERDRRAACARTRAPRR